MAGANFSLEVELRRSISSTGGGRCVENEIPVLRECDVRMFMFDITALKTTRSSYIGEYNNNGRLSVQRREQRERGRERESERDISLYFTFDRD